MKRIIRRYSFFIVSLIITLFITLLYKDVGMQTFSIVGASFKQMLSVLPPIMILLGLMDVWIPRNTMMKYMGKDSGILGIALSILIGSLAAGPMYAAFPFTVVLLKKGVKFSNIMIFLGAWCVTKIPTLIFELTALGYEFTLIRLLLNVPGIIIMGYIIEWLLSENDLEEIYLNAEQIDE